jgi:hypothetical protein
VENTSQSKVKYLNLPEMREGGEGRGEGMAEEDLFRHRTWCKVACKSFVEKLKIVAALIRSVHLTVQYFDHLHNVL